MCLNPMNSEMEKLLDISCGPLKVELPFGAPFFSENFCLKRSLWSLYRPATLSDSTFLSTYTESKAS